MPRKKSRPTRPVFGTGTIVTVVLFAAVVLTAVIVQKNKSAQLAAATPTAGATYLFTAADGTPQSIDVLSATGEEEKLTLNADKTWTLILPVASPADQNVTQAAATGITGFQNLNSVQGPASTFGLDAPKYTITIGFTGGTTHTLEIGDATPTNSGYYARLDKKAMMIVGLGGIDALTAMIAAPPYLYTLTPTTAPATETPAPSPTAGAPNPTATATP